MIKRNKPAVDYLFDHDLKDEGIKHIQMVKSYYMTHNGNITYNDLRSFLCPVKDEAIICYRENLYYHYANTKAGIKEAEQVGVDCEQKHVIFFCNKNAPTLRDLLPPSNSFFLLTNINLK